MEVPFCAGWVRFLPRVFRCESSVFHTKSQPLPPGARRGEPAEVVAARKDGRGFVVISVSPCCAGAVAGAAAGMAGCSERRALLWPLVRVRVGQTRAGVRFPLTVSPAGD